jgi:general secretion pathway protein A
MYQSYFNLKQKPFSMTSNPSFLYLSQNHEEAFSHLVYGIKERVGFIEITGEVGTGKTTLCHALLNHLDDKIKTAFIFNPSLSETQLLQTILEDLGVKTQKRDKGALFSELNHFLIEQRTLGNNVVVIIDEAQNLSNRLLEQIRMLSNLESEDRKLIQIVLVGQPELREKLKSPSLRQLRQRIVVRYHIEALSDDEVPRYIEHRLRVAGANGQAPVFEQDAFKEIYSYSKGNPRLVNVLCDKAMLHAFVVESRHINEQIIKNCIAEIEGVPNEHHS